MNVPVLLALIAKPPIISWKQFFFAEAIEALINTYPILFGARLVFLLKINYIALKTFVFSSYILFNYNLEF